ncbi:MAG: hypothetical protein K2M93_07600 [Muribaculaceae bacterium]|nr:hypothetical protein [Muribaculaceae bacterium]
MKKYLLIISVSILASCSKMEKSEQAAISVETAIIDGRTAGRLYAVNHNVRDTAECNTKMRAMRVKYDTLADPRYVQAFDTAMLHTVKHFRPEAVETLPLHEMK